MHFVCVDHKFLMCRLCVSEKVHECDNHVLDLYLLKNDLVKKILYSLQKIENN